MANFRIITVVALLCSLSISGCKSHKQKAAAAVQLPVATVTVEDVPVSMQFSGQIDGYYTINIDARVPGYLRKMLFAQGSFVRKGQLLYVVEPAPYEAQTAQSEAAVKSAEAALRQAQQTYDRVKPLAEFNAASQSDLDAATAQLTSAKAQLASTKAAMTTSSINFSYTQITSPVDGIIGKTMADVGAFVGAGSSVTTLNTVSVVDSVVVDFYIPETLYTTMMSSEGGIDMYDISLTTSTGEEYPYKGRFQFVGREVQAQTGALNIEVVFPNPQTLLRPGGFAMIGVVTDTLKNACLVPQVAINQIQGNDFVYLLDKSGSVKQQSITSGRNIGDMRVVTSGIDAGQTVITEGFHKLYPGVKVEPQSATATAPQPIKK